MAFLMLTEGSSIRQKFPLEATPVIIGRHPECEVQLDDGSVSRQHAKITFDRGQYYLHDLNSRNGTYLNDNAINGPTKLYDQSEIKICDVMLVFSLSEPTTNEAQAKRATTDSENPQTSNSSVFIDDFADLRSHVMSQLEIPSHYSKNHHHASAEEKLNAITKIAHALSESVERDQVLTRILDFLFELFVEADRGFIILKNDQGILEPLGIKTRRPGQEEQIRISRTIINDVINNRRPVISSDAASDDRFDMSQSIVDFRIRSMMCAPMINSKDEAIGVIQLDTLKKSIAFNEQDLETLVTVAMQASLAVQKSEMFEAAKRAESFRADMKLAHEIQQRFLPQRAPESNGFEFFSYYRPMQQVGGDYFDYVQLDENRIGVVVADVVGHGIPAALLMAKVSAEARFALATCDSPVDAVTRMNDSLSGMNLDRFVTLVLGLLDTEKKVVTLVNAGHMPPILRNAAGEFQELAREEAGIPLGIMKDFEYHSVDVALEDGDVLVMYTDGINEAMNADGQQLTTATVIQEIRDSQTKTPQTIGEQICKAVLRHIGSTPAIDDMCVVCLGSAASE